jgi:peptide subunit release factor 1 (eRF1)
VQLTFRPEPGERAALENDPGMTIATRVTMITSDQLATQLDRLVALDPSPYPVISLYLNLQPDQQGHHHFDPFVRNALPDRIATYPADAPERASLEKDADAIRDYLGSVDPAAKGLAIFASSGAGLFEAMPLAAPIAEHLLHISDQPHVYPLAHLLDQYPRYAVLIADTQTARLLVISGNTVEHSTDVDGPKTKRHKAGGWSQTRFQRHVDQFRAQHAKEVVDVLTQTVRNEEIRWIIIGGDEVITPLLKEEMPKDVAERVIDVVPMDIRAPERTVLDRVLELVRRQEVETDRERVAALVDAYRAGGLATLGVERVTQALELGQVDELLITGQPAALEGADQPAPDAPAAERSPAERAADDLVTKARQTGASLRFIEDPALLEPFGGVGASLRFKL